MKRCTQCGRWWDNGMMICPVCDAQLLSNEASSEDADEGIFAAWILTRTATCTGTKDESLD